MKRYEGKKVVIIGGTSGIKDGKVYLLDRDDKVC